MKHNPFTDPAHDLVGGVPSILGPWQLRLLQQFGLQQHHRVLDIGCGTLRGGLHIVQYLNSHNYVGIDPLYELILEGQRLCEEANLAGKYPRLGRLQSVSVEDYLSFDFVLTQSVINHINAASVYQTITLASNALREGGTWVGSALFSEDATEPIFASPHPYRPNEWVCVIHPLSTFCADLIQHNLHLQVHTDITHPRRLTVFSAKKHSTPLTCGNL